ncbi:MAG TPA: AAA domain-containing protein [Tissierellia bacterium]|nr:AAA domain-containing protein [Tissierellia bacterium]
MDNAYQWITFYEKFADRLLEYSNKRSELFDLVKKIASEQPLMKYLHFEREDWWGPRNYQIDPFSVMGVMNRGIKDENRTILAEVFAKVFDIKADVPTEFSGIPVLNNINSFFAGVDEIWDLFVHALKFAETNIPTLEFKKAFENAIAVSGNGLTYITMGLYWTRPNVFMPLDANSRSFISNHYGIAAPNVQCGGDEYIDFLNSLKIELNKQSPNISFPEVSYNAWLEREAHNQPQNSIMKTSSQDISQNIPMSDNRISEKNIILYGPPGTGKTYSSILYAVAIIEEKPLSEVKAENYEEVFRRYMKYKDDGLIAFTTFHQSYSYEEFIEGIRPVVSSEDKSETGQEIEYEVHDGVFKAFCDNAGAPIENGTDLNLGISKNPSVWKVSLEGTGDNPTRIECLENNHIRIGWDEYGEKISDSTDYSKYGGRTVLNAFYNKMQIGDIVFSCYSSKTIDAIGVITGEPEWHDEYPNYKRLRKVKWLVKGINEDIVEINAGKTMTLSTVYKMSVSVSDALQMLRKVKPTLFSKNLKIPNRVFIIDEINRGNISKIFGELITLIEPCKRINASEQLRSILPYSGKKFGVPDNVYIIGTMNTADRSIAMLDTALRRRFCFVEMLPEPVLLKDVYVEGIDIAAMLETINKRISILLDREHTIGHSYLLPLKNRPTIENLAKIFRNNIIPLLQEYFYDDYEKIQLVLGDNQKTDDSTRFIIQKTDAYKLFGNADINFSEYYEINNEAFNRIDAYEYFK